jgi:hypothetical protein
MADDHGAPIAYTVLREGTPVLASDGTQIGTVQRVLADEGADIFDGITVDTSDGERFVDAPEIDRLYERAVVLTLGPDRARKLPEHSASPAVIEPTADDIAGDTPGDKAKDVAKRAWDRLSGNY